MRLLITSNIPKEIYDRLKDKFEIDYHDSNVPLTKEEIIDRVAKVEAIVCPLSDKIDKDIMEAAPELKIIANYGAGFDNIDLEEASKRDIIVTNAPAPSSAVSTSEIAFSLILAVSRKLITGEKDLRKGNFLGWRPTYFLGDELRGKRLGIIGLGNIGTNVAKRALAFEMEVVYHSRTRKTDLEESLGIEYIEDRSELIKTSDYITLHTAFSDELHHMIDYEEFDMMKESAYLINAARGPLVHEQALVEALKENKIKGAGLDVYEFEPEVNQGLYELDNVVLLPHLGNATVEARMEMGEAVADNLIDYLNDKTPRNKVN